MASACLFRRRTFITVENWSRAEKEDLCLALDDRRVCANLTKNLLQLGLEFEILFNSNNNAHIV
jgi:hypothetical protein